MDRYIVRPKKRYYDLALTRKKIAPEKREDQVAEIRNLITEDPDNKEIRKWIEESVVDRCRGELISGGTKNVGITGTIVVKMSDEDAKTMESEVKNVSIFKDKPLELVKPVKISGTSVGQIGKKESWHLDAIALEALKRSGFRGKGKGVKVAVFDTGVDDTHPELIGKVDGAYAVDISNGSVEKEMVSKDTDGHGTHVAGLICGDNVGVAPESKIVNCLMLPYGHGWTSEFILALDWAALNPEIQIINISAGLPGYMPEMQASVEGVLGVGILPVSAIGNSGRNHTISPGNYADGISVGATNKKNKVSSFSGGGTIVIDYHQYTLPDLVAPGEKVFSCTIGGRYESWNGTSMATPIVSGISALLIEKYPDIDMLDLMDALLNSCKDLGQPIDRQGNGLVQVNL